MPYIHFTEDQKLRANSVDLVEFLRRQGEKLISSGQDKRLTSDHSITVHGNEWYDHAAERGGHAISFVQNFYGLTYPEAVTRLLNGEQGEVYIPAEKKEKEPPKEFALPPSNQAMRRVYAYLLQQRHISREVLSAFAQKGLIYESRELSIDQTKVYHNAAFIESDEHGVMVFLCPVPGFFTAFVNELLAHEGIEYLTVDAPLFQQVGIHTAHGLALRRQHEGLCRRRILLPCRRVASAEIIAEEQGHGVWVAESIELLDEADGSATLLGGMIEPLTAADGDAVVAGKAFVPAGGNELFSSASEELLQVHRRGSFFLLGCKRNVL